MLLFLLVYVQTAAVITFKFWVNNLRITTKLSYLFIIRIYITKNIYDADTQSTRTAIINVNAITNKVLILANTAREYFHTSLQVSIPFYLYLYNIH